MLLCDPSFVALRRVEALRSTSLDFFLGFRPILFHRHKGHYCRFRRKRQGRTADNAKWAKKYVELRTKRPEVNRDWGLARYTLHESRATRQACTELSVALSLVEGAAERAFTDLRVEGLVPSAVEGASRDKPDSPLA
jgi:hypothetical protein